MIINESGLITNLVSLLPTGSLFTLEAISLAVLKIYISSSSSRRIYTPDVSLLAVDVFQSFYLNFQQKS